MTDDPKTQADSTPARLEYGDKTGDATKKNNPATIDVKTSSPRTSGQADTDAGEGHKGPRVDATVSSPDNRSQGDRSNVPNQANQKSSPLADTGKSGNECCS